MTAEDAAACMAIAPRLAKAIMKATGATAYNLLQNNGRAAHQLVMHVHFHIIPKTDTGGLGVHWPAGQIDKSRAAEIQRMITAAM
jgi:histidine triad (HIT) family protein